MTLAIGFGANAAGARAAASRLARERVRGGGVGVQGRLGAVPRHARGRACERGYHAAAAHLRAVAARAGRLGGQDLPRRVDRGAEHGMDLGHAHARARAPLRPVSPRLAARPLPRRHRAEGGRRRRGGRPAARLPVVGAEARRLVVAEHARGRHREVETEQLDQVSLPIVLAWWLGRTGATDWVARRDGRRLHRGQRARQRPGALGEPERLLAEHDRDRDRGPDLRRRHRARERRQRTRRRPTRRSPTAGSRRSRAGPPRRTARTRRSRTTCACNREDAHEPNDAGTRYELGDNFIRGDDKTVDQREIVDNSFLGPGAVRRQGVERPDRAQLAQGRRRDERLPAEGGDAERSGLAPVHVRRVRRAGERKRLGPVLRQPPAADARSPLASAHRRARRVRADRRAAAPTRS